MDILGMGSDFQDFVSNVEKHLRCLSFIFGCLGNSTTFRDDL